VLKSFLRFFTRLRESAQATLSVGAGFWRPNVVSGARPIATPLAGPILVKRTIIGMALIFIVALGVRILCWQDSQVEIARHDGMMTGLVNPYRVEALRITQEGGILLPNTPPEYGNARILVHPPGYSFVLILLRSVTSSGAIRLAQVVADSVGAVIIFLIAEELLGFAIAAAAGSLVALSPHLSYYSLWLTPDSLVALPTLLAVWLLIRGIRSSRLAPFVISGCLIGAACWLRSNSLLLAPFLSLLVWSVLCKSRRGRVYGAVITVAAILVIAPLTIRNFIVFRRVVPNSLGNGVTLLEGIADYDPTGGLGMPRDDIEASIKDSEWYGRPDYAGNLWIPDGVRRDQDRFKRGVGVIASHPFWFLSVMARRAEFMVRYNEPGPHDWPFNTAIVPVVSRHPAFGHNPSYIRSAALVASIPPEELARSSTARVGTSIQVSGDSKSLLVTGAGPAYEPQFASELIRVKQNTDYLLDIRTSLESGGAAVVIMDNDQRVALASCIVPRHEALSELLARQEKKRGEISPTAPATIDPDNPNMEVLHIVFNSGPTDLARIMVGNNGPESGPSVLRIGQADLYEYGPTPYLWTRYPRIIVHGIQKYLFVTSRMLPIVIVGALLLIAFGDRRAFFVLAAVPAYYLIAQSVFHTEYRYALPIHYFLFIFAAVALCVTGTVIADCFTWMASRLRLKLKSNGQLLSEPDQ
jgi:hypothetical protein